MANGRPGDNPISDVVTHGDEVFSPRVNALLRDIFAMGASNSDLDDDLNEELLDAWERLGRIENRLVDLRERLRKRTLQAQTERRPDSTVD